MHLSIDKEVRVRMQVYAALATLLKELNSDDLQAHFGFRLLWISVKLIGTSSQ